MFNGSIIRIIFFFSVLLLIATSSTAQNSGLLQQDLSTVNVDNLSDQEIIAYKRQAESSGLTETQIESAAIARGLPRSEVAKLRQRLQTIQQNTVKVPPKDKTIIAPEDSIISKNLDQSNKRVVKGSDEPIESKEVKKVSIYGQELFRVNDLKAFDRSIDAKAPDNYTISVGDEIGISVFGYSFYNEVLKVDARGAVNLSNMGSVFVKDLTFEETKGLIKSKLSRFFDITNNRVEITLAYSRSITVNIVGEVFKPGSYKIPAINTAFNALIAAGGPNDIGTLRAIQIRRAGKTIRTLDVYEFILNPNSKQDFFLEDNDYIVVGAAGKVIGIEGEVKRPLKYELIETENLNSLIKYAGGLNASAYTQAIQITRINPLEQIVIDLKFDSLLKTKTDFKLQNGDQLLIRKSPEEIKNIVEIRGAVAIEGKYEYKEGEKIADLVKKSGGLRFDALVEKAFLTRLKPDDTRDYISVNLRELLNNPLSNENLTLQKKDILIIASNKDYADTLKVTVSGAVRKTGSFDYFPSMTLGDALFQAGGLSVEADITRIEISRLNYFSDTYVPGEELRVVIDTLQVPRDLKLSNAQLAVKLQPFDQIFVRTVPKFGYQQNFVISGEVKYPGEYTIQSKAERISDVIARAGGLTEYAFSEGASFYRPDLPGGFIVVNLKEAMRNEKSKYNFIPKAGDRLLIPTVIDFIGIRGSSVEYLNITDRTQINAPYVKGKRAGYYVREFGNGFSKGSWKSKTYVIGANAKVSRTKNLLLFNVYPKVKKGSTIYVVEKKIKEKTKKEKRGEPFDWNKFIDNTTIKVTGLITLLILFRQIK